MKVYLGKAADFKEGSITIVNDGISTIAVACIEGSLYAYEDSCTHDNSCMGHTSLVGYEIECPRHGARFDVRTGKAVRMPAAGSLEVYKTVTEGEDVYAVIED